MPARGKEQQENDQVHIPSPSEARKLEADLGQDSLTKSGKRSLGLIANAASRSGGKDFDCSLSADYIGSPGNKLTNQDRTIIIRELQKQGWEITQFEFKTADEGVGSGSWYSIKVSPISTTS